MSDRPDVVPGIVLGLAFLMASVLLHRFGNPLLNIRRARLNERHKESAQRFDAIVKKIQVIVTALMGVLLLPYNLFLFFRGP